MKKVSFNIKKWTVRSMVAIGAMLGLSACSNNSSTNSTVVLYGPPSMLEDDMEQVEDVYGPPVEDIGDEIEPVEVVYGPAPVEEFDTTQKVELQD